MSIGRRRPGDDGEVQCSAGRHARERTKSSGGWLIRIIKTRSQIFHGGCYNAVDITRILLVNNVVIGPCFASGAGETGKQHIP